MKNISKLFLSKTVLGELSSSELAKAKGGAASDSVNTEFTKICECCKTGCPTSISTGQITELDREHPSTL